ncbi:MAG: hypothetical protein ACXAD7_17820 [Candidatus Kariarchaeaceae archaeon]|jgi:hypothetical protein
MKARNISNPKIRNVISLILIPFIVFAYSSGTLQITTDIINTEDTDTLYPTKMVGKASISYDQIDGSLRKIIDGHGEPIESDLLSTYPGLQLSSTKVDITVVINAPGTEIIGEIITGPNLIIQDSPYSIIQDNIFDGIGLDITKADYALGIVSSDHTLITGNTFSPIMFENGIGSSSIITVSGSTNITIDANTFGQIESASLTSASLSFISIVGGELHSISNNLFKDNILISELELEVFGIKLVDVLDAKILGNQFYAFDLTSVDRTQFTAIYMENNTVFTQPKSSGTLIEGNIIADSVLYAYNKVVFTGINISTATKAFSLEILNNQIFVENQAIQVTGVNIHHIYYKSKSVIIGNEIGGASPLVSNNTKATHFVAYRIVNSPGAALNFSNSIVEVDGYFVTDVVVDKSNDTWITYPDVLDPAVYWWNSDLVDYDTYSHIFDGEFLVTDGSFNTNQYYKIPTNRPGVYLSEFVIESGLLKSRIQYQLTIEILDISAPYIIDMGDFSIVQGDPNAEYTWEVNDDEIDSYEIHINGILNKSTIGISTPQITISLPLTDFEIGVYTLELFVRDPSGNQAYSVVTITVIEEDVEPKLIIESSGDMIVEVGSRVNITWNVHGSEPDTFLFMINGTVYENGTYLIEVPIEYMVLSSISGISLNYTLFVNSTNGITNTSTIWIEFVDSHEPLIKGSNDISILDGDLGYSIRWFIVDENYELNYTILLNGEAIYNNTALKSDQLDLNLDHLGEGQYNYTLYVIDGGGNIANDTVIVVVFPNYEASDPVSQEGEEDPSPFPNISTPIVLGAAAVMIFVGGAWIAVRRS